MESPPLRSGPCAPRRHDVLLAGIVVPLATPVLLALGAGLLAAARERGHPAADLMVALGATLGSVLLAAWWAGGLLMLAGTALARRLSWTRLERVTTRLTPALLARAVGMLLGLQLVAVSPAHAGEAVNPFWTSADPAPAQAPGAAADAVSPSAGGAEPAPAPPDPGTPGPGASTALPAHVPRDGEPPDRDAAMSPGAAGGTENPAAPSSPAGPLAPAEQAPIPAPPPAGTRVVDGTLTVVSGDTLWDLTAQLLGPGADAGCIATATATWAEYNDLPGGPDLIRPGDQLRVPPQLIESHPYRSSGAPS